MSRVELQTEKLMAAFGADFTTGSFLQIWAQPWDKQDCALVVIDNQGVRYTPKKQDVFKVLPKSGINQLEHIETCFKNAKKRGLKFPNISADHIFALLLLLGFGQQYETLGREIYKALD